MTDRFCHHPLPSHPLALTAPLVLCAPRRSLIIASALALGLAGFAQATASDLAFYAAKSTLLSTGSTTTDATTALVSGPAVVVTSGSKVSDLNAQVVLQVVSPVADGGSFDLTCTSGTTGSIGSASKVTVTSKTTSPVAASNQYTLASASSTNPVTIAFPSLTSGSACASGLVCGAGTTAVTITCALSATSGTTLPTTLTAASYAFTVDVVDPIPAGVDATLTCAVAADVTGAYLSSAKTTSTDVATTTVTATPLVLSIVPGTSAMRGDTGANFLTNQKLTTNDSVQAIEGNAYGAGGLFKVVLDQNAPEALTVTCLVDSTMSAVLANSTTSTDYTVSIASGSGTSASSITLPAVQSISTASNILLTCTATNAAGRVYSTASTYVAATPLKLVITAANGAIQSINTDGTYTNFKANTDLTSSNNQVVRIEAQADTAGGTVTIKANSAPTAAVTITCTPSDTTVIPSVTVASSISTATAVNVTIGTAAAISAQKSVTVTCAPSSAAGGLSTTDSVTFTVIADPVRFIVKAQTTAIQSIETTNELAYFTAETALVSVVNGPSNGTVYRLEGQADSSGNTLKVYMNAVPSGGSYTLTCSTTGATYSATPALASAVASANSLSGTGVGVDLKTFSDVATATSSVVTCVVSSGADNFVTVSDGFAVNVIAQPLGFIVTAQSGATKSVASTNVLTPFGSATTLTAVKGGSSNDTVFLLEGQTDADSTAGALLLTAGAVNSSFTTTLTVSRVGTGSSAAGTKQSVVAASTTAFQQDQVALSGTYVATDTVAVEVDTTNVKTTVTYTANSTDGVTLANVAAGVKAAVASPLGGATIATDNVLVLTATAVNAAIDTYTVTVAQVGTGSSAVGGLASAIMAKSTNVKQVDAIALSGTFVATDTITVADSTTGAAVSWKYTVNSTDGTTLAQVIAGLKTALGPQLGGAAISSSTNVVTITAATAGTALPTYTVTATGGTATTATQATTTANAAGTKQVDTITIGGTPATGNTVTVTIGNVVVTLTLDSTSVASTTTVASALAAALSKVLNGTAALSTTNAFTITAGTANTAQTTTPTVVSTAAGTVAGANAIAKNTNVKAVDVVYLGGTWAANDTVKVLYALTGSNVSTALTFTVSSTSAATNATALATALGNPLGGGPWPRRSGTRSAGSRLPSWAARSSRCS